MTVTELIARLRDREGFVLQGPAYLMRVCHDAAECLEALQAKIERYEARLEIDHVYKLDQSGGEELIREEVPPEEREAMIDGIECRDATIKLLEKYITELRGDKP